MTAITRSRAKASASSTQPMPISNNDNRARPPKRAVKISPSTSEAEAHSRFVSALTDGVEILMRDHGHGRGRASAELLRDIADGCVPDEGEVFKTMETLGLSMEDATKVITVATAFRKAQSRRGSTIEAIDELTSRLCLTKISRMEVSTHSQNTSHVKKETQLPVPACATTLHTIASSNVAVASKMGRRPTKSQKGEKQKITQTAGRKRGLSENSTEKCMEADEAIANELGVKEIINAKISKDEKKQPEAATRPKAPTAAVARGKRAASPPVHQQTVKRPRTTSDDIPTI